MATVQEDEVKMIQEIFRAMGDEYMTALCQAWLDGKRLSDAEEREIFTAAYLGLLLRQQRAAVS